MKFLRRVKQVVHQHMTGFMSVQSVNHRIGVVVQKGVGGQLLARLLVNEFPFSKTTVPVARNSLGLEYYEVEQDTKRKQTEFKSNTLFSIFEKSSVLDIR